MKLALVVPGGVDRSGERRVIPALLALLRRLSASNEVHVFALAQESSPGSWMLEGAYIHNIGSRMRYPRAVLAILRENRSGPFSLVHSIWAGGCGAVAVLAAKLLRIPSVVHVAGGEFVALRDIQYGGALRWEGRAARKFILRNAAAITAASTPMLMQIKALGHTGQRVPLGVDPETWPTRSPERREPGSTVRLIHVASLNRVKDQATLLRALALLHEDGVEFHLDIVGEDTMNGAVGKLAQQLNLAGRITFHGFLTRQQLYPLMVRAHINMISSRHEAGPLVTLEAAAVGVPTVGTAVGHIAEWAPTAALSTPIGNAAVLASAITSLIQDESLRLQIAAEAMRRACAEDADHTFVRFGEIYTALLSARLATAS